MDAGGNYLPRSVDEVFNDFRGRRAALVKALTTEIEEFYLQCDPEKENLCLYGLPSEKWVVNFPAEEVPPELPEPALGINFARDGMQAQDWVGLVAVHSDSWLLAVAFYFAATFGFDKTEREELFSLMNDLPTIFEIVNSNVQKELNQKSLDPFLSNKRPSPNSNPRLSNRDSKPTPPKEEEEENVEGLDEELGEEDDPEDTLCGACGEAYVSDEFWICCDICETWFHGKCVRITPARAEHMKQYKCPSCSTKRARK